MRRHIRVGHLAIGEVEALLAAARRVSVRDGALLRLIYLYGLRASEPGLVRLDDVHLDAGQIEIVRLKKSTGGQYPLLPVLTADLRAWLRLREPAGSTWLFPDRVDSSVGIDRFGVFHAFVRAARLAGIPVGRGTAGHPHALKHSIATHMLDEGAPLPYVQWWLGHKHAATTEIYAEVSGRTKRAGLEIIERLAAQTGAG